MPRASRAFIAAVGLLFFSGAGGCGSRSDLPSLAGQAPPAGGHATPAGTKPGPTTTGDAGPDAGPDCAADPSLCSPHIVLFGGFDSARNAFFGDTWHWGGRAWTERAVEGPSPRAGHAMATLNGKVVLFGGGMTSNLPTGAMIEGPILGDTWEWDGTVWTERNVTGPSPRSGHAMATLDGKVVLFGGGVLGHGLVAPETWQWDGVSWSLRATTGPSARSGHTMTTVGDRVLLFGGAGAQALGDLWSWDGDAWTAVTAYGVMGYGPPARHGHVAASLGDELFLVGGAGLGGVPELDMWSLNAAEWGQISTRVLAPLGRYGASMAALGDDLFLFGGYQNASTADDSTYVFASGAWGPLVDGPPPREESAMATQ